MFFPLAGLNVVVLIGLAKASTDLIIVIVSFFFPQRPVVDLGFGDVERSPYFVTNFLGRQP